MDYSTVPLETKPEVEEKCFINTTNETYTYKPNNTYRDGIKIKHIDNLCIFMQNANGISLADGWTKWDVILMIMEQHAIDILA